MKPVRMLEMLLVCSLSSWTLICSAQADAPQPHEMLSNGNLIHTLEAAPVLNAPFSAQATHEVVKTLPDGSQVRNGGHHLIARDSQGRTRVEVRFGDPKQDQRMVFVSDPVSHSLLTWTEGGPGKPVVLRTKLSSTPAAPAKQAAATPVNDGRPQPVITQQDLGPTTVEGVAVNDVRITTVVPVGRSGNTAPITKTEETWASPDLKLIVKQQWSDPRTGVRTQQLEHLSRTEPDATLFRTPAGYPVKDTAETLRELAAKLNTAADALQGR
jgi:hypothetical protein